MYIDIENGCLHDDVTTEDGGVDVEGMMGEGQSLSSFQWNLLLDPQVSLNNVQG